MTALLNRLPAYKKLLLDCIEAAESPDDIMVCKDFIHLFGERFRSILTHQEFMNHWLSLHDACEERYNTIIRPA